jgi:hypothetical protein
MGIAYNTSIVRNGLVAQLDAANPKSYPGTGTTIIDLSGNGANGTINGTISYVNAGSASYWNFSTASDSNYISSSLAQSYIDCTFVLYPDFSLSSGIVGLVATSAPAALGDRSLRFATGTPWSLAARNPGNSNDWAYPSATNYYVNGVASNTLVSGWNIFGGARTNLSSFPSTWSYFIGSSGYTGRSFQGRIAACYMYNRVLTAAEQLQNFEALRGRYGI